MLKYNIGNPDISHSTIKELLESVFYAVRAMGLLVGKV
jgi:hypothetical protein